MSVVKVQCDICGYQSKKSNLKRHIEAVHNIKCVQCEVISRTRKDLRKHVSEKHEIRCDTCSKVFKKQSLKKVHEISCKNHSKSVKQRRMNATSHQASTSTITLDVTTSSTSTANLSSEVICDVCGVTYKKPYRTNHLKSNNHVKVALKMFEEDGMLLPFST